MLKALANRLVSALPVSHRYSVLRLQSCVLSGICSQQDSSKTWICIPLNSRASRAERSRRRLHRRHSEGDFSRSGSGRKTFINPKNRSRRRAELQRSHVLAIVSRRGNLTWVKVWGPQVYKTWTSARRGGSQWRKEPRMGGESARLQQHAPWCHIRKAQQKEQICWSWSLNRVSGWGWFV